MRFRRTWTRAQLQECKMPFGDHKGEKFDDVPINYLDWLLGEKWFRDPLKSQIKDYLADPLAEQARKLEGSK